MEPAETTDHLRKMELCTRDPAAAGVNVVSLSSYAQRRELFSNWFNIGIQINDKDLKKEDIDNTELDKDKNILILINDKNSETEKNDNDDNLISTRKNHSSALGSTTKVMIWLINTITSSLMSNPPDWTRNLGMFHIVDV